MGMSLLSPPATIKLQDSKWTVVWKPYSVYRSKWYMQIIIWIYRCIKYTFMYTGYMFTILCACVWIFIVFCFILFCSIAWWFVCVCIYMYILYLSYFSVKIVNWLMQRCTSLFHYELIYSVSSLEHKCAVIGMF
jgi:hypothetical protein